MSAPRAWAWRWFGQPLLRCSLHNAYRFRRAVLRAFGATLAEEARVRPSARIHHPWNLAMGRKSSIGDGCTVWADAPVTIGARSVISQFTTVSAWSARDRGARRTAPIRIGDDAWIAAECHVCAGAVVPDGTVVGARSVVEGEMLEPWTIAVGDPARSRAPRAFREDAVSAGGEALGEGASL